MLQFNIEQKKAINDSASLAEEVVSNYYKISASRWLHYKYDIKTFCDLNAEEIIKGPVAQIIRYEGQKKDTSLGSNAYDFYKICLQDHAIISTLQQVQDIFFSPFMLYIIAHELIHIVRFCFFQQCFVASNKETMKEETRVHSITYNILKKLRIHGLNNVFSFYNNWLSQNANS